jgi:RNA polymerase sigma factor (sigma-70 family)
MDAESIPGTARADRDLLRAFVDRADGDAFAELVTRHGPLVLGVCRRVLADAPEAEDAFQATFLILARKAGSVSTPEKLGSWLYGVALRCASQARKAARRVKRQPIPDVPAREAPDPEWADVGRVLDAEIGRLPDKLRVALVLCELQGMDRAAAAERLGVPVGTVSSRLSRAKDALRRRLVRRGITLSLVGLGLVLAQAATAAVPLPLVTATAATAVAFAAGTGGGTPAALAARVMWARAARKTAVGVGVALLGLGLIGAILLALFGRGPVPDDRERIQGTWRVVVARFGIMDARDSFGPTVTIDDRTFRFLGDATYTMDPDVSPKAFDLVLPFGGNDQPIVCQGVYELTGDRLNIHLALSGQERPRTIQPEIGVDSIVLVLARVEQP